MSRYRRKDTVEAMQFITNNECGSPCMDAIVNWMNVGQLQCKGWHNSTDIFVMDLQKKIDVVHVGDWVVKSKSSNCYFIMADEVFNLSYEIIPGNE